MECGQAGPYGPSALLSVEQESSPDLDPAPIHLPMHLELHAMGLTVRIGPVTPMNALVSGSNDTLEISKHIWILSQKWTEIGTIGCPGVFVIKAVEGV